MYLVEKEIRKTDQFELPLLKDGRVPSKYDVYPTHSIGESKIFKGYEALADAISGYKQIKLDGYVGIRFGDVKERLNECFIARGVTAVWIDITDAMLAPEKIKQLVTFTNFLKAKCHF